MRQFMVVAAALTLAIAASDRAAQAQVPARPLALKVGIKNHGWWVGADYTFRRGAVSDLTATVEWFDPGDEDVWGFQGVWKRRNTDADRSWYYGAGVGFYTGHGTSDWGIPLVAGYNLNANWFLEGKYHFIFGGGGDKGIVGIGYRF